MTIYYLIAPGRVSGQNSVHRGIKDMLLKILIGAPIFKIV